MGFSFLICNTGLSGFRQPLPASSGMKDLGLYQTSPASQGPGLQKCMTNFKDHKCKKVPMGVAHTWKHACLGAQKKLGRPHCPLGPGNSCIPKTQPRALGLGWTTWGFLEKEASELSWKDGLAGRGEEGLGPGWRDSAGKGWEAEPYGRPSNSLVEAAQPASSSSP